jgi:hypothetical protein
MSKLTKSSRDPEKLGPAAAKGVRGLTPPISQSSPAPWLLNDSLPNVTSRILSALRLNNIIIPNLKN